jgi:hypothetical protein
VLSKFLSKKKPPEKKLLILLRTTFLSQDKEENKLPKTLKTMVQTKQFNNKDKYNKIISNRIKSSSKITTTMSYNTHRTTSSSRMNNTTVTAMEALVAVEPMSLARFKICLTNMTNMLMK